MNFSHEVVAGQTRYAETTVTPRSGQVTGKRSAEKEVAMTGNNVPKPAGEPGARGIYGIDAKAAHPARVYDYWLGGCFR
jgi:hypothetical protein